MRTLTVGQEGEAPRVAPGAPGGEPKAAAGDQGCEEGGDPDGGHLAGLLQVRLTHNNRLPGVLRQKFEAE